MTFDMGNIQKYAILIGVSEYQDSIQSLPYVYNDVYRMAGLFRNNGFSNKRIYVLGNFPNQIDPFIKKPFKDSIMSVIKFVAANARTDDLIFLYVGGHIVDIFSRPYLITTDSKLDFLLNTTLGLQELLEPIEKSRCQNIIKIFDVCRQHFARGRSLTSHMTDATIELLTRPITGHATLVSCSPGNYALESPEFKQGICSYFVNNALSGLCTNNDGPVTWELLSQYVVRQMRDWCSLNHAKQIPIVHSEYYGPEIFLRDNADTLVDEKPVSADDQQDPEKIPEPAPNPIYIQTLYHKDHIKPIHRTKSRPVEKNFDQALKLLLKATDSFIRDFSHPSISVFRTEPVKLNILSYFVNQEFETFLQKMDTEAIEHSMALQIFFRHSLAYAPQTALYLNLVKFGDYYWIWYCLPFETLRTSGQFTPENPIKTDMIAMRTPQFFDEIKLERYISDIFRDCTETIIDWVRQLHNNMTKS